MIEKLEKFEKDRKLTDALWRSKVSRLWVSVKKIGNEDPSAAFLPDWI
jgi:hypothetical protein